MNTNLLSQTSRIGLLISCILLVASIFNPVWSIYLTSAQYPEGLSLFIHTHKITGDDGIINGLNQYIGMKEIVENNFWEFTILPYSIILFSILFLVGYFLKSVKFFQAVTISYFVFGLSFLADFYFRLYDYGHNLNPNAAIIVPGMSYQPPLIGHKTLLNFEVWSYPNTGGILMFLVAFLLLAAYIFKHSNTTKKQG